MTPCVNPPRCHAEMNLSLQSGSEAKEGEETSTHRRAELGSAVAGLHGCAVLSSRRSCTTARSRRGAAASRAGGGNAGGRGVTTVNAGGASCIRATLAGAGCRARGRGGSLAMSVRTGRGGAGAGAGRVARGVLAAQAVERVAVEVLADDTERWVGDVRKRVLEGVPPDMVVVLELAGDLLPVLLGVFGRRDTLTLVLARDGPAYNTTLALLPQLLASLNHVLPVSVIHTSLPPAAALVLSYASQKSCLALLMLLSFWYSKYG